MITHFTILSQNTAISLTLAYSFLEVETSTTYLGYFKDFVQYLSISSPI